MIVQPASGPRELRRERIVADLIVVGGGLAGLCAAIAAARGGLQVALVQDRPVLGGNASSEVRLWVLGATSHMGNNNRWAREGGILDEFLVENTYRNPEGNPVLVDALLLDLAAAEKTLTLLLNTAVHAVETSPADGSVCAARAFCAQNSTAYELVAPLFCDASGDGILAFLAGAAFRMGAESRDDFGEKFAPSPEYGELLGHSLYFYTKRTGGPVKFIPPSFALRDITRIPRYRMFNTREHGCQLWWIEHGGRVDTVHQTEAIKWELWRVVYGVWDYIKNSGQFPDAENLALEWVGTIPGKRESRRFEGDAWLTQHDIVEQRSHSDAVAFGGWSIDLHPADGVYSERPGCNQWHAKGVYQIPYRCLYSRNVPNLFLAGRVISASHVAFGSSRVMGTSACIGQAVGEAAVLCHRRALAPRALLEPRYMEELQCNLLRRGHYIPGLQLRDAADLAQGAVLAASSEYEIDGFPCDGPLLPLDRARAMMLPVDAGAPPRLVIYTCSSIATSVRVELRRSARSGNHTPDVLIDVRTVPVPPGEDVACRIEFDQRVDEAGYAFICFFPADGVALRGSNRRVTGVLALGHEANPAVAKSAVQTPPPDIGVESFEFWVPQRRPAGYNIACRIDPPLRPFGPANLVNGVGRPTNRPNAWAARLEDNHPAVTLTWPVAETIARVELGFDTDFDHPMESVLMGHPEREMPFCVQSYRLFDDSDRLLHEGSRNHQSRNVIVLEPPVVTSRLRCEFDHPSANVPAAMFEVRCYARPTLPG